MFQLNWDKKIDLSPY